MTVIESAYRPDGAERAAEAWAEMLRNEPPPVKMRPSPVPGIIETTRFRPKPRIRVKAGSRRWPGVTPALREAYEMYRKATAGRGE